MIRRAIRSSSTSRASRSERPPTWTSFVARWNRDARRSAARLYSSPTTTDFYLDPMVSDAYFSMITYMQNRYYSSASRYTTSAFMRLKLGAGLAERNLAPHVFETWPEAQAFSAAQQRS